VPPPPPAPWARALERWLCRYGGTAVYIYIRQAQLGRPPPPQLPGRGHWSACSVATGVQLCTFTSDISYVNFHTTVDSPCVTRTDRDSINFSHQRPGQEKAPRGARLHFRKERRSAVSRRCRRKAGSCRRLRGQRRRRWKARPRLLRRLRLRRPTAHTASRRRGSHRLLRVPRPALLRVPLVPSVAAAGAGSAPQQELTQVQQWRRQQQQQQLLLLLLLLLPPLPLHCSRRRGARPPPLQHCRAVVWLRWGRGRARARARARWARQQRRECRQCRPERRRHI